ncbi:hypothetical protein U746_0188 [Mycolicibacterium mucogenicum 261Sha1.1M5]|nr:hypothetical protein U746_0188 [Mycolicibacterium mucogenicum 261Sha1.1M5]
MALHWKLIIDSARPHALADFWAAALEYVVEDPGLLVAELVRNGDLPESAMVVHAGTPRFAELAAVRHPDDPFDPLSGAGRGRRLLFQAVPEPKSVKNRLHIDVHDDARSLEELAHRLELLGASRVERVDQGPAGTWWVMRDPEGNEFCAVGA